MKNISYIFALALTLLAPEISLSQTAKQSADIVAPIESSGTSLQQGITLTKISDQALATQKLVEKLKPMAAHPIEFEELNDRWMQFQKQLADLQTQTTNIINDRKSSIDQIRTSQSQWRFFRDQLVKDQQKIRERGSELEIAIAQLSTDEQAWKQTQAQVKDTPELNYDGNSLKTAMSSISSLRKQLSIPLQEALTLEQEWQELIDQCDDAQASLKNDEIYLQSNLLNNIQPPIWKIALDDFQIDDSAKHSFQIQTKLLSHYSVRYLFHLQFIVGAVFGIIFFIKKLRQLNNKNQKDHIGIGLKLPLLEKPISTVTAFAIFSALFILPNPPQPLKYILLLLLIFPILHLGIPRLATSVKPMAWLVSLFFVVNKLGELAIAIPALHRLWIFGCAIVGFFGCIYVLRRTSFAHEKKRTIWRVLQASLWLSLFAVLIAMIGNILGAVTLSQFILTGMAHATYAALCLAVLAGILNDIAVAAVYMPASEFSHLISSNRSLLIRYFSKFITFVFLLTWIHFSLSQFALWDSIVSFFSSFLTKSFTAGSLSISVGDFLSVAITIWLSFKLSQLLRFILTEDIAPRTNMARGVPEAIGTLMQYFIVLIGFFTAISMTGLDLSKLAIMAGALGVGIGIGLQDVVSNFTSGLILLFEQNIKQADTVQCGTVNGQVMHIGMRCSIIRTSDGAEVIVPNGKLTSDQVINWTRSSQERRITVPLSTTQNVDPNKVIETLLTVAKNDRDIIDMPPTAALLLGFGAGTMNFELRAWVNNSESLGEVNSRLCAAIAHAFAEAGIIIPFQQQDVYIRHTPATIK